MNTELAGELMRRLQQCTKGFYRKTEQRKWSAQVSNNRREKKEMYKKVEHQEMTRLQECTKRVYRKTKQRNK